MFKRRIEIRVVKDTPPPVAQAKDETDVVDQIITGALILVTTTIVLLTIKDLIVKAA